jgi:ankyrin repeat protein
MCVSSFLFQTDAYKYVHTTTDTQMEDVVTMVSNYAHLVERFIRDNRLDGLKAMLKGLTADERQQIVNYKVDGNAALHTSCIQGHADIAEYLLETCRPDIEQLGTFIEYGIHYEATSLWIAAVKERLDVLQVLVKHGADVNCPSKDGWTPVGAACRSLDSAVTKSCSLTKMAVVKFLVEKGADVHKGNVQMGGSCLIYAVQITELCEFIIVHGVDINAKDHIGESAFNYAIAYGMPGSLRSKSRPL